ncbi:Regulatory protein E2, partial [Clarias magur]
QSTTTASTTDTTLTTSTPMTTTSTTSTAAPGFQFNITLDVPSTTTPMNPNTTRAITNTTQAPKPSIVLGLRAKIVTTVALNASLANSILQQ